MPEGGLHNGPVGHPPVPGDRVEVEVPVQVVLGPFDLSISDLGSCLILTFFASYLPNDVLVFPVLSRGEITRLLRVNLKKDLYRALKASQFNFPS